MTTRHVSQEQVVPLREQHAALTRSTVLNGVAEILAEGKVDFSVQDVANRSGVALRTVYRHFDSRDGLIAALVDELEAKMSAWVPRPARVDDVPDTVIQMFLSIEELGPAVATLIASGLVGEPPSESRQRRTDVYLNLFRPLTTHLDPGDAEAVAWVLRQLVSGQTWTRLRRDGGIHGERSGRAAAWAVEVLVDALRRGEGPGIREESKEGQ